MCQLKAEAKEAYSDYLPFRGAILGCSAAANAKLRAATEGTPREGRCSWDPLSSSAGTEARLLSCSLEVCFFFFQMAKSVTKAAPGDGSEGPLCPLQCTALSNVGLVPTLALQGNPKVASSAILGTARGLQAAFTGPASPQTSSDGAGSPV